MADLTQRPISSRFWPAYLDYRTYPSSENSKVWEKIGGSIGQWLGPKRENSCAARVSYGLNHGGAPIAPFEAASMNSSAQSYKGVKGDGKRYIVSAMKMAAYLRWKWGSPDHSAKTNVELSKIIAGLKDGQCALFATPAPPGGHGHAGVLRPAYDDPFVSSYLPVDVWMLS